VSALFTLSFLAALLAWPWVLGTGYSIYALGGAMWVLVGLTWFYNSSDLISFWDGLNIAAKASQRGCAGLGILLVFPVLVTLFLLSQFFLIEGLLRGRHVSQNHWAKLISWFGLGITQTKRARS
jgi:hypothetical protein